MQPVGDMLPFSATDVRRDFPDIWASVVSKQQHCHNHKAVGMPIGTAISPVVGMMMLIQNKGLAAELMVMLPVEDDNA
ncbi:hypothetical protein [Budvicia aquatica]|uniref:hypothetical protein n=1 Tax=Budvicia aquatica TaxID=82979 RepID=UPI00106B0DFB|nr:hypothetical protein [Budvicia aquatica]